MKARRKAKMFEKTPDTVFLNGNFSIDWTATGVGFGRFSFIERDGKVFCDNEFMSKRFIKEVLNQLVDECVLLDTIPEDKKEQNQGE